MSISLWRPWEKEELSYWNPCRSTQLEGFFESEDFYSENSDGIEARNISQTSYLSIMILAVKSILFVIGSSIRKSVTYIDRDLEPDPNPGICERIARLVRSRWSYYFRRDEIHESTNWDLRVGSLRMRDHWEEGLVGSRSSKFSPFAGSRNWYRARSFAQERKEH